MEQDVKILEGISDTEKGAYLAAIASIATADSEASDEEIEHLTQLCQAADLSAEQTQVVLHAASSTSEADLARSLDILKNSELKYSLVTDLFAFAKSDGNYSEAEQQSVSKISGYLGINQEQYGLLGEVAEKANSAAAVPEQAESQGFLGSLGLGDKLKSSGINSSTLLKGLVSVAAPIILSRMMGRNRQGSAGSLGGVLGGSGGLGGLLGGAGGGIGGMLGGGGGGIGSLIGMLSGGRGMGSAGGLLGKILGR